MKALTLILFCLVSMPVLSQNAMPNRSAMAPKVTSAYTYKTEAKINEFFGYLELLTDPKLNNEMKTQVKLQALLLFGNENSSLIPNFFSKKEDNTTITEILDKAGNLNQKQTFSVHDIRTKLLTENPKPTWQSEYTLDITGSKKIKIKQLSYLKEEYKQFGSEKKKVATIYLSQGDEIK